MMNEEITIYRVRKSPYDIASQKGAYILLSTAVKRARKTRRNVYDNKFNLVWKYEKPVRKQKRLLFFK